MVRKLLIIAAVSVLTLALATSALHADTGFDLIMLTGYQTVDILRAAAIVALIASFVTIPPRSKALRAFFGVVSVLSVATVGSMLLHHSVQVVDMAVLMLVANLMLIDALEYTPQKTTSAVSA